MPLPVRSQIRLNKPELKPKVPTESGVSRPCPQRSFLDYRPSSLLSVIPMSARLALLYLQEQSCFLLKDIPMACNHLRSLHGASHHRNTTPSQLWGFPGPSTLWKDRGVRGV